MRILFISSFLLYSSLGINAQTINKYICGNGKFAMDLHNATVTADSLVKIGKSKEAIEILLPYAFDIQFGDNSASLYSAQLIKKMYSKQDIEKELKRSLVSIRAVKQNSQYGQIKILQMSFFDNDLILPDQYYWLGRPVNKSTVDRKEINADVSISKTKKLIESSLLYSILRK